MMSSKKSKKNWIKQYYEGLFLDNLNFPSFHQFRHYRGRTATGAWKKVPFRINTPEDIKKWVLRLGIQDLYYSTSGWLNPHKVGIKGKGGSYKIADNCLLFNDLTFDIDAPEPITLEGLEKAKNLALKIYRIIKSDDNKKLVSCSFTGNKGFRLVYEDETDKIPGNATQRVDYIEEKRKIFIHDMKLKLNNSEKSLIDEQITINPLCVVRVLGSVNSKTGFLSVALKVKDLRKSVKTILKNHVPLITREGRLGKNSKGVLMTSEGSSNKSLPRPRPEKRERDVSNLASSPKYFFTNKVSGTKCFIPVFKYPLEGGLSEKAFKKLFKKEKLGFLHELVDESHRYVFSFKMMQFRACKKLLFKGLSLNRQQFAKRRRVLIPFNIIHKKFLGGEGIKGTSKSHCSIVKMKGDSGRSILEIVKAEG